MLEPADFGIMSVNFNACITLELFVESIVRLVGERNLRTGNILNLCGKLILKALGIALFVNHPQGHLARGYQ